MAILVHEYINELLKRFEYLLDRSVASCLSNRTQTDTCTRVAGHKMYVCCLGVAGHVVSAHNKDPKHVCTSPSGVVTSSKLPKVAHDDVIVQVAIATHSEIELERKLTIQNKTRSVDIVRCAL